MEERSFLQNEADGTAEFEAEMIVKGIEISWTTWGRMRGEKLITGAVSYLKAEGDKGFERIYSVDMKEKNDIFDKGRNSSRFHPDYPDDQTFQSDGNTGRQWICNK